MQEMLSFTGAIAVVALTSSSKMPNSPDLNSANHHTWGMMQDCVYQTPIQDAADLRQCLVDTWSGFS